MFGRLFRNAASEQEDGLADRGPARLEGPEKILDGGGKRASSDSSSGVTVVAPPAGTLDRGEEDFAAPALADGSGDNENVADGSDASQNVTDGSDADENVTGTAVTGDELATDSPPSERGQVASGFSPGRRMAPDSTRGERSRAEADGAGDRGVDGGARDETGDGAAEAAMTGARDDGDEEVGGEAVAKSLATEPLGAESFPSARVRPPAGPLMAGRRRGVKGRRLARPEDEPPRRSHTPEQRLLLLDTWQRSGLPAKDFAALVGVSQQTLYKWRQQFERLGPAGLMDQPRGGPRGSRLPELTKRTILMMKAGHPEWGCQRISDMLLRGPALAASASAVARVLHEAGYERVEEPTRPHPDRVRRFERARPNQLWQTDLFTFVLKRQNRRVYLVAFMDDHSRFITGYGLHASQSSALVLEVLRAGIASYGTPEEILTDNGSQYVTWRGKSAFTKELEKRGIRQIVARPRRPQTLGKIERFWGTLWRECVETAVFLDLGDARQRIGLFIDHYNFQRPHRGVDGLVPADRFFGAAPEVFKTLQQRVATNALELARQGVPKQPFYLTGQLDGQPFSVHREGDRVVLRRAMGAREEVELVPPPGDALPAGSDRELQATELPQPVCPDGSPSATDPSVVAEPPAPGTSPLDQHVRSSSALSVGTVEPTAAGSTQAKSTPPVSTPPASDRRPAGGQQTDQPDSRQEGGVA